MDSVADEQLAGTARVLGGDDVGLAQRAQRAQRDVLHIANGRADDEEFTPNSVWGSGRARVCVLSSWLVL
jgi:hypothetical protein